ncbi:ParB/RepB/Spo0J family partition protein [Cohnella hashimotonis]|uniref:ParB/RepB/Spo0J family partition protein n=1 Tax=Cohnella hashimotonis TaxID=2826895 RepID=A0ABT6TAP5_9BACL|nr:ParB/RepB/Spo0J family partition protein [Cohnella hashimotonis]MDI4643907.1 ParB/RepB/Spo0J family partition protein [Cohnella hashimotonis]
MQIIELPMNLIDEDKDQPRYRFGEESLQELVNSIDEIGLLSPIKVRKAEGGRYKIIYGNRRYLACSKLGRDTIPAIVSESTDETEIYLEQVAENLTREGFTPIEEGEAFDKLLNDPKFASSVKFLAAKLGKPESYIKNKCELLKFGPAVKKLVVSGTDIRKGTLTEDQLLPLKDLPMEYRDPLALTMAKDEMPVIDVKRIAKLFKDASISERTKSQLLYKDGPGLLDTWSAYEASRKERARAAADAERRKAEAEAEREEAEPEEAQRKKAEAKGAAGAEGAQPHATAGAESAAAHAVAATSPAAAAATQPGAAALGQTDSAAAVAAMAAAAAGARTMATLRELLAALPAPDTLAAELQAATSVDPEALRDGLDDLIGRLEGHLSACRTARAEVVKRI